MKTITTIGFDELLSHAEKMGYYWNQAHDLLVDADIFVGQIYTDHYKDCFSGENEHVDAKKILKSFMDEYDLKELYITPKNHDCT
jgi:hypothetical protein